MMPNLTLQQTQDLALVDGDLAFDQEGYALCVEGAERVAQHVQSTLRCQRGEWFLDLAFGTPWFESILGANPNLDEIRSVISLVILSVPDVASIEELDLTFDRAAQSLQGSFIATNGAGDQVTGELS